jgi:hypothetical protein
MTFDFTYDTETEEIHIIYDNYLVLKAAIENSGVVFQNFDRIDDEGIEAILKNLCRQTFNLFT